MSVDKNNLDEFAFFDSFESEAENYYFELEELEKLEEEYLRELEEIQEEGTFFEKGYIQEFFEKIDKISDSFFGKGKGKCAKNIMPHFHRAYVYEYYE